MAEVIERERQGGRVERGGGGWGGGMGGVDKWLRERRVGAESGR